MQQTAPAHEIVVGVDTHKHTHTAVALDALGARLGTMTAPVSRYERVIGDTLRSRTDRRQVAEVAIAVSVLNRMLELGRPDHVRIG